LVQELAPPRKCYGLPEALQAARRAQAAQAAAMGAGRAAAVVLARGAAAFSIVPSLGTAEPSACRRASR